MPITCDALGENIVGPYEHTLFLGCSISGLNISLGWNEQVTTATVNLVEDTCTAPADKPKRYYDRFLNPQTTTEPDPGFYGEKVDIIGCPVYLRLNNFEFAGIVQSWEKGSSTSGNPAYTVQIVTPIEILQGAQIILADYSGSLETVLPIIGSVKGSNVFNVYGFLEQYNFGTYSCPTVSLGDYPDNTYNIAIEGPDGPTFGSYAQNFGGAATSANGILFSFIRQAFGVLCNAVFPFNNSYSPYGRLLYKGVEYDPSPDPENDVTLGCGIVFDNNLYADTSMYMVDITDLPVTPATYRIGGSTISVMEMISKVCSDMGYDYYLELNYVRSDPNDSQSPILNILKVRTVSRNGYPVPGMIQTFIDTARDSEKLVSSTYGKELRNEVTSAFLIGANKQTIYQATQNPDPLPSMAERIIIPYFGVDYWGDYIIAREDIETPYSNLDVQSSGPFEWTIQPDVTQLNNSLQLLELPQGLTLGITEILMARASFDMWTAGITANPNFYTDTGTVISNANSQQFLSAQNLINSIDQNNIAAPRDAFNIKASVIGNQILEAELVNEDIRRIHEWVASFADFLGRDFLVRVPFTTVYRDAETLVEQYSELPTNDGGWTERTHIGDIPKGTFALDFLSGSDGKIQPFVRAQVSASEIDLSVMSVDNYVTYNLGTVEEPDNAVFIKANVEEKYLFAHDPNRGEVNINNPRVHVTLSDSIILADLQALQRQAIAGGVENPNEYDAISGLMRAIRTVSNLDDINDRIAELRDRIGSRSLNEPGFKYPALIDMACIPIKSNILTYGPWFRPGPSGQVRIERDDTLAPWNYGGIDKLNLAAANLVSSGVTLQRVGEVGQVTIVGYPEASLGSEIMYQLSVSSPDGDRVFENRQTSSTILFGNSVYYLPCTIWNGNFGPNITGISISMDSGGLTTTYHMRTFSPYPGRFAKLNAERLKQIGQQRVRQERQIRNLQNSIQFTNNKSIIKGNKLKDRERQQTRATTPQTPHEVLVGELYEYGSGVLRPLVASESMGDLVNELNNYSNKAVMSLDGLIRPISMDGDGGLPRFILPLGKNNRSSSFGSIGPIFEDTADKMYYGGTGDLDSIELDDLNPFTNQYIEGDRLDRDIVVYNKSTGIAGHDIDIIGRRGTGDEELPLSMTMITGGEIEEGVNYRDYRDDYRPLALRGPLVMQSWGYDINGKPVPNAADIESDARLGIFESEGLKNYFLENWLQKPQTWPVANVDLRLDRERGLWVAPPPKDVLTVEIIDNDIEADGSGVGRVILEDGEEYYNASGDIISEPKVVIHDVLGDSYTVSSKRLVKYHEKHERWEIIGGGGGGGGSLKIVFIDADISGVTEDDPYDTISGLNLYNYSRQSVDLKYYVGGDNTTGRVPDNSSTNTTIKLASTASNTDNYYNGETITLTAGLEEGQSRTITDYNGSNKVATVDTNWTNTPNDTTEYSISANKNLRLAYEIVDDEPQYLTTSVWYDDGKPFLVGEYKRSDYPDFPENETFPPDGLPSGFLSRKYRGIAVNNTLVTALCQVLPAPELP